MFYLHHVPFLSLPYFGDKINYGMYTTLCCFIKQIVNGHSDIVRNTTHLNVF